MYRGARLLGGAFVAAACYLILLALGAGFGLSAISPWSNVGESASTAGTVAIIWLIFIEVIAAALGGYLTGRLRTKWALIHTDEVYFRDTANGFLAWAIALVISATLLASAAALMAGNFAKSGAPVGTSSDPNAYFVDTLFRSERIAPGDNSASVPPEVGRIWANALRQLTGCTWRGSWQVAQESARRMRKNGFRMSWQTPVRWRT